MSGCDGVSINGRALGFYVYRNSHTMTNRTLSSFWRTAWSSMRNARLFAGCLDMCLYVSSSVSKPV